MFVYMATNADPHHYTALQYTATHGNTLQHTATHCNTFVYRAINADPQHYAARSQYGLILHKQNNLAGAREQYVKALKVTHAKKNMHCIATRCNALQHCANDFT